MLHIRMNAITPKNSSSQVFSPLLGRQPPSSALRLGCSQGPPKLTGRCRTAHSGHLLLSTASFHWVCPWEEKKNTSIYCKNLPFICNSIFGLCQLDVPVFCTLRRHRILSIRFQERLDRIQKRRFAVENGREVNQLKTRAELQWQHQRDWQNTHQPIGNRKCKFHQHFKNWLPEGVLWLLVCKS